MESITKRREKLQKQIKRAEDKLDTLQEECPHVAKAVNKHWNDHDGWSIVDITWYTDYHCPECDKYWSEESGLEKAR